VAFSSGEVHLNDDFIVIYYNASDGQKVSVPIDESEKVRLWGAMVEARRVELLSENSSAWLSTSVVCRLNSLV